MHAARLSLLFLLAPSTALALRPTDDREAQIELASGDLARPQIEIRDGAPAVHPAWQHFVEAAGGTWKSMWDRDTGVPVRIWGSGIAAPKSVRSPEAAERFARAFIAEHIALFAPGSTADDFVLAANDLSNGVRSVGFLQTKRGVLVAKGQVS